MVTLEGVRGVDIPLGLRRRRGGPLQDNFIVHSCAYSFFSFSPIRSAIVGSINKGVVPLRRQWQQHITMKAEKMPGEYIREMSIAILCISSVTLFMGLNLLLMHLT